MRIDFIIDEIIKEIDASNVNFHKSIINKWFLNI